MKPNGFKYEGGYVNDLKQGFGKTYHLNGDIYEGNYLDGVKSGKGKLTM
jgi:hypothetical protein